MARHWLSYLLGTRNGNSKKEKKNYWPGFQPSFFGLKAGRVILSGTVPPYFSSKNVTYYYYLFQLPRSVENTNRREAQLVGFQRDFGSFWSCEGPL